MWIGGSQHVREHKERMSLYSSLVLFQVRRECLSFHLRRTRLSLQFIVCVSVQLFTELLTNLHAVVAVHAQFTSLYALAQRGVWPFGQYYFSHRIWAQRDRQLRLLRDYWNLLPGAIQRHDALVLAWRGAQWRDHRQSALFTTVHSGARRTSGPKISLSLFWRKFVDKSVLVCLSCKYGETSKQT